MTEPHEIKDGYDGFVRFYLDEQTTDEVRRRSLESNIKEIRRRLAEGHDEQDPIGVIYMTMDEAHEYSEDELQMIQEIARDGRKVSILLEVATKPRRPFRPVGPNKNRYLPPMQYASLEEIQRLCDDMLAEMTDRSNKKGHP